MPEKTLAEVIELPPAPVEDRSAICDAFGLYDARCDAFKPIQKERDRLRDQIAAWAPSASVPHVETGIRFKLTVSARANERTVPARAAYKALGASKFFKCAVVSLKSLGLYLAAPLVDELAIASRTGPRTITVTPILTEPVEVFVHPKAA